MKYFINFWEYRKEQIEARIFFNKYEKIFLWLLNHRKIRFFTRKFFGIDPSNEFNKKKIIRFTPSAVIFRIKGNVFTFRGKAFDIYAYKLSYAIKLSKVLAWTASGSFLRYLGLEGIGSFLPVFALTTETFSPDVGGRGRVYVQNATYSTAHDAASGTEDTVGQIIHELSGGTYTIGRCFFPFDTSALPNDAIITAGANFVRLVANGTTKLNTDTETIDIFAPKQKPITQVL